MRNTGSHFHGLLSCFCIIFYFYILSTEGSHWFGFVLCLPLPVVALQVLSSPSIAKVEYRTPRRCHIRLFLTFGRLHNSLLTKGEILTGFLFFFFVVDLVVFSWCFCLFSLKFLHTGLDQNSLRLTCKNYDFCSLWKCFLFQCHGLSIDGYVLPSSTTREVQ